MSGRRSALVAALAFALRVAALHAAPGKELDAPRLVVVVNDYAGAAPDVLELAKSHVIEIYRAAGVAVDWVDREDPRLDDQAFLKSIVTVSLFSEEMGNRADVRDSVVGKAPPGGRTVKVLYHRLEEIWTGRTPEAAFLLGNVIAHEIGHLVLPGGAHARFGLMAPEMTISIATSRLLFFTPAERKLLRGALSSAADD